MNEAKKKVLFFAIIGIVIVALVVSLAVVLSDKKPKINDGSSAISSASMPSDESSSEDKSSQSSSSDNVSEVQISSQIASTVSSQAKSSIGSSSKPSNVSSATNSGSKRKVITGKIDTTKYNLYTWLQRYWEGNRVYNESVYPMTTDSGENEVIRLLYDASKILEVRSSDLKTLYVEGKDYKLENGKLVIPKGSSIKVNSYQEYYPSQEIKNSTQVRTGGGYLLFAEGAVFHQKQIAVTYEHTTKWTGPTIPKKGSKLPGLQKLLDDNGSINLVFFGDSISCGANASAESGAAPFTPSWPKMFASALREMGATVNYSNPSVGGEASTYGAKPENLAKVIRQSPDLVVIGWGMNDGGYWHGNSPATYKANIKSAIDQIRKAMPECEIILVGTIWPNEEAMYFYNLGAYQQYTNKLYELEQEYSGVAVASMTEIHKSFLERKNYRDMTGNNINHPNDFISRLYLQVLLTTIS